MPEAHRPLVAAYYFPNFHRDPRNEAWHGEGWTEWELARRATPRFEGHEQPRVPLLGYQDEADPAVMRTKIALARDHGIDAFLFDWYWYEGRPYLERPLETAFLPEASAADVSFAVMWANHHWSNIHPWKSATPVTELASGFVDAAEFTAATDHILQRYLHHPAYLRIDGRPYLSIYDLATLVTGLGGLGPTRAALTDLRARAARAGHDLHLNAIGWEQPVLPQDGEPLDIAALVERLGFDSVTSYVWVHHHGLPTLRTPYADVAAAAARGWEERAEAFPVPYHPNVTVGWDPSPRTVQSDGYDPRHGYPHTNIIVDATPERFGRSLEQARDFAARTGAPLVTLNAWNEWTEGSYLEPDTVHGHGHLEQVRRVFGVRDR